MVKLLILLKRGEISYHQVNRIIHIDGGVLYLSTPCHVVVLVN